MKVGLIDVDGHNYPNLALMKIARYHRQLGDRVEWCNYLEHYDKVYKSKVFTFTLDDNFYLNCEEIVKGGTGYDTHVSLSDEIDRLQPDYSIYYQWDSRTALGFLTRGCPNRCKWCVVPQKEGAIKPYMDIEEICIEGRNRAVLMDNNILACDYGLEQIEKIIKLGIRVDFNQAMDARLVTPEIAKMLARVKWIKRIRFGCDTPGQIAECERAIELIDGFGYKGEYFFYCILIGGFNECFNRVQHWKQRGGRFLPYCQPYRDFNNAHQVIPQWQKDLAGWTNKKWIFKVCEFKDFMPRKGFKCEQYFNQKL